MCQTFKCDLDTKLVCLQDERCRFKRAEVKADLSGCKDIPSQEESALMEAVGSDGPVSVAIDASHQSFQMYSGGNDHLFGW